MACWLVKTEPEEYSIDDLKKDRVCCWDRVRNYEARNNLRQMKKGDTILVYHSNADPSAIVGVAALSKEAYPDATQFDSKSDYFDPKATTEHPRWFAPDYKFVQKLAQPLAIEKLREAAPLKDMVLLRRGSRLSVQPISDKEFEDLKKLLA